MTGSAADDPGPPSSQPSFRDGADACLCLGEREELARSCPNPAIYRGQSLFGRAEAQSPACVRLTAWHQRGAPMKDSKISKRMEWA